MWQSNLMQKFFWKYNQLTCQWPDIFSLILDRKVLHFLLQLLIWTQWKSQKWYYKNIGIITCIYKLLYFFQYNDQLKAFDRNMLLILKDIDSHKNESLAWTVSLMFCWWYDNQFAHLQKFRLGGQLLDYFWSVLTISSMFHCV